MPELENSRRFRLPIFTDYAAHSARLARVQNNKSIYMQENPASKEVYMFMRDPIGSAVAVRDGDTAMSALEKSVYLQQELGSYLDRGYVFKYW